MTTLAELRARVRATLGDETAWPDAALDGWIADALRFYSAEFPRIAAHTVALEAGVQTAALPTGCMEVVAVAYPAGETPVRYLAQTDERSAFFRAGGAAYALRADGCLALAETPLEGEAATVVCTEARAAPDAGDDDAVLDAPDAHLEALIAFCEFRAHWERETAQAATLEAVSLTLAQLGENARRAWNRYREVIDRLRWLTAGASAVVAWGGER